MPELKELANALHNGAVAKEIMKEEDFKPIYNKLLEIEWNGTDKISELMKTYEKTDIFYAMVIFYYMSPHQLPLTSKEDRLNYGPFVPKLLLALKEKFDKPYDYWDKKDKYMKYALGMPLEHLLQLKPNVKWSKEKIIEIRNELKYNSPNNTWSLKGAKNPAGIEFRKAWGISINPLNGTKLMSAVPGIILHWWQAHDSKRIPGKMILHPYNWDEVPEPVEEVEISRVEEVVIRENKDLTFEDLEYTDDLEL